MYKTAILEFIEFQRKKLCLSLWSYQRSFAFKPWILRRNYTSFNSFCLICLGFQLLAALRIILAFSKSLEQFFIGVIALLFSKVEIAIPKLAINKKLVILRTLLKFIRLHSYGFICDLWKENCISLSNKWDFYHCSPFYLPLN